MIETYVAESTILRTEKLVGVRGEKACEAQIDMTRVYLTEAVNKLENAGREAINSYAKSDKMKVMLMGLKRFTKMNPFNTKNARRSVAEIMIEEGKYTF
jgi:hypothetical protein